MHNVLVYGTLRPGNKRKVEVPGAMYDLGSFPGIRLDRPDHTFVAELVTVDDETLTRLDSYEGYYPDSPEHSLYLRKRYVNTEKDIDAWVYEYNSDVRDRLVDHGCWLTHVGKERGGAAYLLGELT